MIRPRAIAVEYDYVEKGAIPVIYATQGSVADDYILSETDLKPQAPVVVETGI